MAIEARAMRNGNVSFVEERPGRPEIRGSIVSQGAGRFYVVTWGDGKQDYAHGELVPCDGAWAAKSRRAVPECVLDTLLRAAALTESMVPGEVRAEGPGL